MTNKELNELVDKYCPYLEYNDLYSWFVIKNQKTGVINCRNKNILFMFENLGYSDNCFQTLDDKNEECCTWCGATQLDRKDKKTIIEILKKLYISYKKINMKLKMDRIEKDF
jgi:hypothetical protein